jgi:hypothetical protein
VLWDTTKVTRKITAHKRTNISTNGPTKQLNTSISHHTPLQTLTMSTGSERRSPNQVKLVTPSIFRPSMQRIKVTCDGETAMLCLAPRDPTHLAACRRWPALCGVSALCVRCGIDTTLLSLCRRLSIVQSLRGNRFQKSYLIA